MTMLNVHGDYDWTAAQTTDARYTLAQAALLRLRTRRGSYWFDPTLGSRLYLIKKHTVNAPTLAIAYVKEAIQPMLNDKRIVSIDVLASGIKQGMMTLQIDITPMASKPLQIIYPVKVGG